MNAFETIRVTQTNQEQAPDGSSVFPLLSLQSGALALFELNAGQVSRAVRHRSVDEIWLVLSGQGSMWRQRGAHEETVPLEEGVCVSIPAGTAFQFRCDGSRSLRVVAVTMPPWPGNDEAVVVPDKWDRAAPPAT
ncbi:MAG TPA: cupin domain-containing protein [Burkholderiales bacterium]|nr:cupin domain-containing protein [Burkholderiales bacterium]